MDIKKVIKEKGYTIQDVATRIGVNRVTLTLTLQGNPTYNKLKQIADAIDCDVMDFFKDEATRQPQPAHGFSCPHCGKAINVEIK